MQNYRQKRIVTWLSLLSNPYTKFNFISNDKFIEKCYHQNCCKKSKNVENSF